MAKRVFQFFVYSNLFIVGCAVLMLYQTFDLLLGQPVNEALLLFVLSSTLCSYSFHWYLSDHTVHPDERLQWLLRHKYVHGILFIAGLAGAAYYFLKLTEWWPWLLGTAFITFLYSAPKIPHPLFRALRKVALGKTIFLALVWMTVTTVLPIIISGQAWRNDFTFFMLHRYFLVYAICILFDYRDRDDDKADGIRSLITYLDDKKIFYLFVFSLLCFGIFTLLLLTTGMPVLTVLLLLIPGIITALLYSYATRHFSDILYYFVLDGLMALPALLTVFPGI